MKLTKKSIDAIKPIGTDRIHWDDELRSRRLTVGNYGRLTPDEARREARRLLGDVERGIDPAEQRLERET